MDYLSKPVDAFEATAETLNDTIAKTSEIISNTQTTSIKDGLESTTMTLREHLEKERAEGKWPSVDERLKEQENNISKYTCDDIQTTQDAVDIIDAPHKVHIKRVKKHKKHRKSNNIYITINIGR